jgi:hypothetical protein
MEREGVGKFRRGKPRTPTVRRTVKFHLTTKDVWPIARKQVERIQRSYWFKNIGSKVGAPDFHSKSRGALLLPTLRTSAPKSWRKSLREPTAGTLRNAPLCIYLSSSDGSESRDSEVEKLV